MKILLARPRPKNLFSSISLIYLEPLDLEYLYTISSQGGHDCQIYDGILELRSFKRVVQQYKPDIVALTGYITQRDVLIEYSNIVKNVRPTAKVILGGVHAELNYQDFYKDTIDYIVHSGGLKPFEQLVDIIENHRDSFNLTQVEGICFKDCNNQWLYNKPACFDPNDLPIPHRSHFYSNKHRYKYLMYSPCAIVKTSYGCPHNCNFCYCKNLNGGSYSVRDIDKVVEEIENIDCRYIHIVDDTFLVNRQRIINFIELIKSKGIEKNYIIYSRADFIANNTDLISMLKDIGVCAIIVGLEAVEDQELEGFDKGISSDTNKKSVEILNNLGIECIGLFIVDIDARPKDFKNIADWIKANNLKLSTVSIFTPLPGTANFDKYKDQFITDDISKWDFLHLVLKPKNISILRFYYEFYKLNFKIFRIGRSLGGYKFLSLRLLFDVTMAYTKGLILRRKYGR